MLNVYGKIETKCLIAKIKLRVAIKLINLTFKDTLAVLVAIVNAINLLKS